MIPIYRPFFTGREKDYVTQCIESTWISSKGEFIDRFERTFADFTGAKYATSVCNGTVAIHLALKTLGIGRGDEVIVPTLTYVASVNPVVQVGATPVFVDSLESTWQINPAEIEGKITAQTKAVVVVHLYGMPCDMKPIVNLCKKHDLYLIEDCAEAFGSKYNGTHVGSFGDIATYSFFGNKTITTGEGGMVVARSKKMIEKAYHLKTQGVSPAREYWHDTVGYNYRMTNICAAIGLAQIEHAESILSRKRQIAEKYIIDLRNLPLTMHAETLDTTHSYWMCSLVVDDADDRDKLREHMKADNIETRPLFFPAHILPHLKTGQSFPIAESLSKRGINLPSFPGLNEDEIDYIVKSISGYFVK